MARARSPPPTGRAALDDATTPPRRLLKLALPHAVAPLRALPRPNHRVTRRFDLSRAQGRK
jgi:hypothetical protein